jgi:O-antigen/teichoic acid export membrane protein
VVARYRQGAPWARRALLSSIAAGFSAQGLLVISGILVARSLGVTDRGHLALLTVIAGAAAFVGTFGVPDALAYFISRQRPAARSLVRRVMPLGATQAAVVVLGQAAVLALVVGGERHEIKVAAVITIGWTPAFILYQYALPVIQAERRFVTFNVLRVLPLAAYAVLVITAVVGQRTTVATFALAWVAAYAVSAAGAAIFAARATRGAAEPAAATVRQIASFGARGVVGLASLAETFRIDQLVAGLFLGAAPLGLYAVAAAFTALPAVTALGIGMVEYPHVAPEPDRAVGRGRVLRYLALTLVLCGTIVAALEVMIPTLLPWLFGADFAAAVPVARILLLGSIPLAARRVLSDGLRGLGKPTAGTFAELVTWAALVPMLAVLTPLFGIKGVAAAVAFSAAIGATFLFLFLVRGEEQQERGRLEG